MSTNSLIATAMKFYTNNFV